MKKASRPFEQVFIHMTGVDTKSDGPIMMFLIMDGYSEYAFDPVLEKAPVTNKDLERSLKKLFDSILKQHKIDIHPEDIEFITSLPDFLEELIRKHLPLKHKLIFDADRTKKAMKSLLSAVQKIHPNRK